MCGIRSFQKFLLVTVAIVLPLHLAGPALAASDGRGWVESLEDIVDSIGATLMSPFTGDGVDVVVAPPMTMQRFADGDDPDRDPFWHLLEDAGYELKEVKAEVGIIPGLKIEFVLIRELSEADRNSLERKLEIDAMMHIGLISSIKRRIIRTLLDASDFEEMRIEELTISLLPLPSAEFVLAPVEAPLGEEHDVIWRAVQEVQRQSEELGGALGIKGKKGGHE
jgi:hypothetical protein